MIWCPGWGYGSEEGWEESRRLTGGRDGKGTWEKGAKDIKVQKIKERKKEGQGPRYEINNFLLNFNRLFTLANTIYYNGKHEETKVCCIITAWQNISN